MDLKDLTCEHFAAHVGDVFNARISDEEAIQLELIEAKAVASQRTDTAFALLFRGPQATMLAQAMYELDHPDLGTLPIFLVPVAEQEQRIMYEAVFTRLSET